MTGIASIGRIFHRIGINMRDSLTAAASDLSKSLSHMRFTEPVHTVYDPTIYAWERHVEYLEKYGSGKKKVLFLGMNPGPFGMTQTGVPFGEIPAVRDWMGISGAVGKPKIEHPKRPIDGFACTKSEVSGRRLWGMFAERFPAAKDFFKDHFVANYCPLVWMSATGSNITPDKIRKSEMEGVEAACLEHLQRVITILEPQYLIGVGAYAEGKFQIAVEKLGLLGKVHIGKMLHPSPASPAANKGWPHVAVEQLEAQGVWKEKGSGSR